MTDRHDLPRLDDDADLIDDDLIDSMAAMFKAVFPEFGDPPTTGGGPLGLTAGREARERDDFDAMLRTSIYMTIRLARSASWMPSQLSDYGLLLLTAHILTTRMSAADPDLLDVPETTQIGSVRGTLVMAFLASTVYGRLYAATFNLRAA